MSPHMDFGLGDIPDHNDSTWSADTSDFLYNMTLPVLCTSVFTCVGALTQGEIRSVLVILPIPDLPYSLHLIWAFQSL